MGELEWNASTAQEEQAIPATREEMSSLDMPLSTEGCSSGKMQHDVPHDFLLAPPGMEMVVSRRLPEPHPTSEPELTGQEEHDVTVSAVETTVEEGVHSNLAQEPLSLGDHVQNGYVEQTHEVSDMPLSGSSAAAGCSFGVLPIHRQQVKPMSPATATKWKPTLRPTIVEHESAARRIDDEKPQSNPSPKDKSMQIALQHTFQDDTGDNSAGYSIQHIAAEGALHSFAEVARSHDMASVDDVDEWEELGWHPKLRRPEVPARAQSAADDHRRDIHPTAIASGKDMNKRQSHSKTNRKIRGGSPTTACAEQHRVKVQIMHTPPRPPGIFFAATQGTRNGDHSLKNHQAIL